MKTTGSTPRSRWPCQCSRVRGLAALVFGLITLACFAPRVLAQDPPAVEPAAAAPDVVPPAAAPANQPDEMLPGEPAKAAPPAGEQVVPKPQSKSTFLWFIETSGLIGGFIFLLSIYFVSTVGQLFLQMRQSVAAPPELVDELMELLEKRDFKEIYAVVKEDKSFIGRLLATGITELPNGLAEARDAMERVGEAVTVEMEKRISMLAVLGTLGPMIGLLGTLKGMISSFTVIATHDTTLKASEVAGGISEALILTFEGVLLSVPAIYFYAVFRNRVSTISVTTVLQADEYLRRFAHAARAKAPGAAVAQPGTAPAPKPAKP